VNESQLETGAVRPQPSPQPVQRWGPFEDLQRVGGGSFGEVYRAFDPTLQRHVALKLLIPTTMHPHDEGAAVVREARAMARLRHPNIVPIYGVDRHAGRVGFWSDFIEGETLEDLVATRGAMGAREAAAIGIDVCRAVGAVHAAGLVHRDIKAGNVMREAGGRILLMDFGLSQEHGSGDSSSGTPLYMAPELFEGQPATIASDIYAIGVLLFNLLTRQYPIRGANQRELRVLHANGSRRTLLDVRPDLPEPLVRVVETAIDPIPEKRFASVGRMAAALSEAIGVSPVVSSAERASPKKRARRMWLLVSGAALAATASFVLVPQIRASLWAPRGAVELPVAAARADYTRAHDLVGHYYRPQALETAIALLEKVVAEDPRFAPAFADLARANLLQFIQQRQTTYIEPARAAALHALSLAPSLASPHVTLGALYARTSQNELAHHELEQALKLDRFNAAAYGALADLYAREGRVDQVEPTLQKALALAPDDWNLVQQLGQFYLDGGRWSDAGTQYRHAADLVPDNPRAHNNLGLVYRGLDRLDESAAAFQRAIALEPTFLRYRNLGMVLAEAGKFSEAVPMLQRSIDMRPDHYRAWGLLGFVYLNQGADPVKIRETFQTAIDRAADLLKQTPRDEYLLADVGGYYAALSMESESLPRLRQAAALAPGPEVLYQVAVAYEMLHRRAEALDCIAKAAAAGYPRSAIARNPLLARLREDPRYAANVR
jgi:Tfp pilus assembly protein PilF